MKIHNHHPNIAKPAANSRRVALALACLGLSACAPVMEATRPTPVDLSQLAVGEKKVDVIATLGTPVATVNDGNRSQCDVYKLYTHGPAGVGKGVAAAGEAVTDVLTLGLTEVIWTPLEAGTRNKRHTVMICYDTNTEQVASIKEDGVNPQSE